MTGTNQTIGTVSLEEIQQYIDEQVEESMFLEYKEADAIGRTDGKRKEIAKDVSAMANSSGGRIIYGIRECKENKHLPEAITPIKRNEYSKEWLEQVLAGNISPRIEGIIIHPVACEGTNDVVYVIDIPKSTTAHQNTLEKRYYKRYNFQSVPMDDYEIRDVMNRAKHPAIDMEFYITTEVYRVGELIPTFSPFAEKKEPKYTTEVRLYMAPRNVGDIYARYVTYFVDIPADIIHERSMKELASVGQGVLQFQGDNTYRDVVDYKPNPFGGGIPKYGSSRYDPILPRLKGVSSNILLVGEPMDDTRDIIWQVHADNAEPRAGLISIKDIPVHQIRNDEDESE